MKCSKCGTELTEIYHKNTTYPKGYVCVNSECEIYEETWTLAEHKDNQDWNVRHTRLLEQRVQTLESLVSTMSVELKEIKEAIIDAKKA